MRQLRRDRDISIDQVASATGINVSTISRVERRLMTPTPENLKLLARFFKVAPEDLLKDAENVVRVA